MNKVTCQIYNEISDFGFSPAQFAEVLNTLRDGDTLEVRINSPGGSITDGLAIANRMKAEAAKREVVCVIDGLAASMASVIACCGTRLEMPANSFLMIHNPWTMAVGDSDQLRHDADLLDSMKRAIVDIYAKAFDRKAEEIAQMMNDETWIRGSEIDAYGLKATVIDELAAAACIKGRIPLDHIPDEAKAFYATEPEPQPEPVPPAAPEPVEPPKGDDVAAPDPVEPAAPGGTVSEPAAPDPADNPNNDTGAATVQPPTSEPGGRADVTGSEPIATPDPKPAPVAPVASRPGADIEKALNVAREWQSRHDKVVAELARVRADHEKQIGELNNKISEADKARLDAEKTASELQARLTAVSLQALAPSRDPESWADALKASGGDPAKARVQFPTVYEAFMRDARIRHEQKSNRRR